MRGLDPRIHVFAATKAWMAGTTGSPLRKRSGVPVPAMTTSKHAAGVPAGRSRTRQLLMPYATASATISTARMMAIKLPLLHPVLLRAGPM
jgi:hypothetical protein